jgi:hypothetical protein
MLLEPFGVETVAPEHAGGLAAAARQYGQGWARGVIDGWFRLAHYFEADRYQWVERLPELCGALRAAEGPEVARLLAASTWGWVSDQLRLWTTPQEVKRAADRSGRIAVAAEVTKLGAPFSSQIRPPAAPVLHVRLGAGIRVEQAELTPISGYLTRTRYHQPKSNNSQPIRQPSRNATIRHPPPRSDPCRFCAGAQPTVWRWQGVQIDQFSRRRLGHVDDRTRHAPPVKEVQRPR